MPAPTTADLMDAILGLREATELGFAYVDRRFDEIGDRWDHRFTALENRVEAGFCDVGVRFKEVDKRFEQVDARLDQVDARLEQVNGRLGRVNTQLAGIVTVLTQAGLH
jgi:tetrahydromethanopterin S-methyltransferase subunit G